MKKKLSLLFLLSLLLLPSCTLGDDIEEATLSLSEEGELIFTPDAQEKSISVSTNRPQWTVVNNCDWVEVRKSGNELTLLVSANTSDLPRKGAVLVSSGNAHSRLSIVQNGSPMTAKTNPEALTINSYGTTSLYVDVLTNATVWTAETDVDWIKVTPLLSKRQMRLEILENKSEEPRSAYVKIINRSGDGEYDFEVTQEGIDYFALPFLNFVSGNKSLITDFEFDRRSALILDTVDFYSFSTTNPKFPFVSYMIRGTAFIYVYMLASSPLVMEEDNDRILAMLSENGFTEKTMMNEHTAYYNKEKKITAELVTEGQEPGIVFRYNILQDKPHGTFDQIPYGYWNMEENNVEAIMEYEASVGGRHESGYITEDNPEPPSMSFFNRDDSDNYNRVYFLDWRTTPGKARVREFRQVFKNTERMFWVYRGFPIVTNEFKQLMEKDGFKYVGYDNVEEAYSFFNERINMRAEIIYRQYPGDGFYSATLTLGI